MTLDRKSPRCYIKPAAELAAGVLVVIIVMACLHYASLAYKGSSLPEGWEIITPPDEVSSLAIMNDTVWTGGKGGLILVDRISREQVPIPGNPPQFGFVHSVILDHEGRIWVGHDGGLARYDPVTGWYVFPDSGEGAYPYNGVLALVETKKGDIWAGSTGGIALFHNGSWNTVSPEGGLVITSPDVLFEDRNGMIWIGSSDPSHGGLYTMRNGSWTYYSAGNGLPHQAVRMIYQDREGTIWIATGFSTQGGLLKIQNGEWSVLKKDDGLTADNARAVYEDSLGRLWVGSEYDGIAIRNGTTWRILTTKNGLAGNELKTVKEDSNGGYWLGTSGGLNWVKSGDVVISCGCTTS